MAEEQRIEVPVTEFIRQMGRDAGKEGALCILKELRIQDRLSALEERVTKIRISFVGLVCFMAGSGLLGGFGGALIVKAFGG